MDKEISSPAPIRSPLSSILNISSPTSEEQAPEDDIYNASTLELDSPDRGSAQMEYATENEPPELHIARELHLSSPVINQIQVRVSRSQSLDMHFPTQLDTIAEVSTKASSRDNIRPQRSQSLDEARLDSRLFQTSSSNNGMNYLSIIRLYPKQPVVSLPERTTTPPDLPTFNTRVASRYRIPSPPLSLCERLGSRPSPERLSWIRQTSGLPSGAIMRAENGTLVRGSWKNPSSDHTGSGRRRFKPTRDPFRHPWPLDVHPVNQFGASHPLEAGQRNQEKQKVKRWKRF